jgi:hypothetical protein
VRYGTPKPLQGLSIRLSLHDMRMRRERSNMGLAHTLNSKAEQENQLRFTQLKKRGFVNLVPRGQKDKNGSDSRISGHNMTQNINSETGLTYANINT